MINGLDRNSIGKFLQDAGLEGDDLREAFEIAGPLIEDRSMVRASPVIEIFLQAIPLQSLLSNRTWRLLEFKEPCLITGDEPLLFEPLDHSEGAIPSPSRGAMWMPLGRQHALALTDGGREGRVGSSLVRARRLNSLAAERAERWIVCHPDDAQFVPEVIPPPLQTLVTRFALHPVHQSQRGRVWFQPVRRSDGTTT